MSLVCAPFGRGHRSSRCLAPDAKLSNIFKITFLTRIDCDYSTDSQRIRDVGIMPELFVCSQNHRISCVFSESSYQFQASVHLLASRGTASAALHPELVATQASVCATPALGFCGLATQASVCASPALWKLG